MSNYEVDFLVDQTEWYAYVPTSRTAVTVPLPLLLPCLFFTTAKILPGTVRIGSAPAWSADDHRQDTLGALVRFMLTCAFLMTLAAKGLRLFARPWMGARNGWMGWPLQHPR